LIKNNRITQDDDGVRIERLTLISSNVDIYSAELGLAPDKLDWALNASDTWADARSSANTKKGHIDEAYQEFQLKVDEAVKYYAKCRGLLSAIIKAEGGDAELLRSYGFIGRTPRRFKQLSNAIEQWKETHDDMVSAGDTRVVIDDYINHLLSLREAMIERHQEALAARRRSAEAFKKKREIFDKDTAMLQFLFSLCKMTWGPDSSKLELLGFKTRSGVWSEKTKTVEETE